MAADRGGKGLSVLEGTPWFILFQKYIDGLMNIFNSYDSLTEYQDIVRILYFLKAR